MIITHDITPREPSARRGLRSNPAGSGCDRLVSELKNAAEKTTYSASLCSSLIESYTTGFTTATSSSSALSTARLKQYTDTRSCYFRVGYATEYSADKPTERGCKPPSFTGVEGAVGLIQWLEKMENTLDISSCPEHHKVRYAAGSFSKRALTWWNAQIRAKGRDEAMAMPWAEFKLLLRNEFCPKHELQQLEIELSNHEMKGADHMTFTNRYHELVALVPEMVPTLEKLIDRYVAGLPSCIQSVVLASYPATLESAISLSAKLTKVMVKSGVLKDEAGKAKETTSKKPEYHPKKKQKVIKNYAAVTPLRQAPAAPINPATRGYGGEYPQCTNCKYHHPAGAQCRKCTNCGRYGHWVNKCRLAVNQATNTATRALPPLSHPQISTNGITPFGSMTNQDLRSLDIAKTSI
ncbi:hypothetical protein E3N88_00568 [Mikania micrantha]|uniref:CCHC-type domain-containing protein n=1 Tax=Mikania micrantha TaxID=192012 RepID=A0A5N6PYT7_9ASTR|nr:hypothetical protein E3N88_00568 [Mikania micrantha]